MDFVLDMSRWNPKCHKQVRLSGLARFYAMDSGCSPHGTTAAFREAESIGGQREGASEKGSLKLKGGSKWHFGCYQF